MNLEKGSLCVCQCGIRTEPEIEINLCFTTLLLCQFAPLIYNVLQTVNPSICLQYPA